MRISFTLIKVLFLIVAFGAVLIHSESKYKAKNQRLSDVGIEIAITVQDKFREAKPRYKKSSPSYKYCIVYAFKNQQGQNVQGEICLPRKQYDGIKRGDKLTMVYLEDQPDIISIKP